MDGMVYTTLATLLAVFYAFYLSMIVGKLRDVHSINGPATAGNIDFERAFRAHQNTNEQLILMLPCLWLAAPVVGDLLGGVLGLVWVGGRFIYANAYMAGESRMLGMSVTALTTMALFLAAAFGAVASLFG